MLGRNATMIQAFRAANDVLLGAVQGIADLIVRPGLINVDFADVRTVMSEMGLAMMGTGTARGDDRAQAAAEAAIQNPLLDDVNLAGANGILVNITAGPDFTMASSTRSAAPSRSFASEDATVVIGTVLDPDMQDEVRVTVVATGLNRARAQPVRRDRDDVREPSARRSSWSATPPPACRSSASSTPAAIAVLQGRRRHGHGHAACAVPSAGSAAPSAPSVVRPGGCRTAQRLPRHPGVPAPPGGLRQCMPGPSSSPR